MSSDIQNTIIAGVSSIVGALIAAVGAVIAARKEMNHPKLKAGATVRARPLLVFAATGGLLLSMTALGVTFYLQTLPRLGYAFESVIICSGSPDPRSYGALTCYDAPQQKTGEHHVLISVPRGGKIVGAWYTLEDAISALAKFESINVEVDQNDNAQLKLSVRAKPGDATFMRIRLHAVYTP